MDEILKQSLLYDFYGELLTDHQKEIYEQFIVEDLSLSEIAKDAGISRQGVHDLVKRCDKILEEAKTDESQLIQDIRKISGEIIEEL